MAAPDPDSGSESNAIASRSVALAVLNAVLRGGQPLEDTMARHPGFAELQGSDRPFARLLVTTVLRRLGEIDAAIDTRMERALPGRAHTAIDVLRLGAAQLLFLDTPPHAAVDTSVRLVESAGQQRFKGLVNAVLRRLSRERGQARMPEAAAGRCNTPDWLWRSWVAAYGEAVAEAIAVQHLHEAPLDFTLRDPSANAFWAERLEAIPLPGGSLRRPAGGRVETLAGYAEGAWWIQDVAASLPARLLGNVAGKQVIDLCAAPGGKTLQLAAAGARVTAVDLSPRRLDRLSENLKRTGLAAEVVCADAAAWRPETLADAVLLDAPCSATGTIRRHPDIARGKTAADIARLTRVQRRLLDAAAAMLRPGGVLVYAVCSLQREEGPELIATALKDGLPLEGFPIAPEELQGFECAVLPQGDVRTLPSLWAAKGGMDGFYLARFRCCG
jgi:16S rRNA (cytosine967-C5)-methyltransferase